MNQDARFARLQSYLRSHRLRVTVARLDVFHALCRAGGQAVDRETLTCMVQRGSPGFNQAAINRAVRDLVRAGLIVTDKTQPGLCRFRVNPALGLGTAG